METDLLRTFLEVNRTRHFGRAADNLCLTPSAVSARIRLLETRLGVQLLTRQRNDIGLTPAGERLLPHATAVLALWDKARQDVAQGEQRRELVIAAPLGLWDSLPSTWSVALWRDLPDLALRLEVMGSGAIRDAFERGLIDIGLTFDAPAVTGLVLEQLMELPLRLYRTPDAAGDGLAPGDDYILVDWGSAFAGQHARCFPTLAGPRARVATGRLAVTLLLANEGGAYLTDPMAADVVSAGRLATSPGAPVFSLPVFAAWRESSHRAADIQRLLALMDSR